MVSQTAGSLISVARAKFSPGTVAIGIDGSLRHAQLAGDLLGTEVTIDQAQALALTLSQSVYEILCHSLRLASKMNTVASAALARLEFIAKLRA